MFRVLVVALLAVVGIGLFWNKSETPKAQTSELSTKIDGQQFLLNAQDFDLQEVIALIRDNKLKDAADLEQQINNGSAINNVDVDNDGSVDFVKIKETRKGSVVALEFLAVPSATQNAEDAVTVATINFSRTTQNGEVQVQGGYPNHVNGHENNFYSAMVPSFGSSIGQALFLSWLFMPSRPYFYAPMPVYVPHPVAPASDLSRSRSAYSRADTAGKVSRSERPSSFDAGSQKPKRSFSSLRREGGVRPFEARSVQNPPPRASSFKRAFGGSRGFRRR